MAKCIKCGKEHKRESEFCSKQCNVKFNTRKRDLTLNIVNMVWDVSNELHDAILVDSTESNFDSFMNLLWDSRDSYAIYGVSNVSELDTPIGDIDTIIKRETEWNTVCANISKRFKNDTVFKNFIKNYKRSYTIESSIIKIIKRGNF